MRDIAVNDPRGVDEKTRRANRRLAVLLGLVALGFYLLMLFVIRK